MAGVCGTPYAVGCLLVAGLGGSPGPRVVRLAAQTLAWMIATAKYTIVFCLHASAECQVLDAEYRIASSKMHVTVPSRSI